MEANVKFSKEGETVNVLPKRKSIRQQDHIGLTGRALFSKTDVHMDGYGTKKTIHPPDFCWWSHEPNSKKTNKKKMPQKDERSAL